MRWFVSRHPGAIAWAENQPLNIDRFIPHLDVNQIQSGDIVIGTLPVHLAEKVCSHGARYYHLSITLPESLRGQELTKEQMNEFQAKLAEYTISRTTNPDSLFFS